MKKKEIYIQDEVSSCGACSIASIVSHYGGYVPLETILEDTDTDKNGTNAYMIIEALRKYGFDSEGYRISLEDLTKLTTPFIAHVVKKGYEHFLVIYSIENGKIITMDPEFGKETYSQKEFMSIYDGVAIDAIPKGEIPLYKKESKLYKILLTLFKDHKKSIAGIYFLSIAILFINIILSFHLKLMSLMDPVKLTVFFLIMKMLGGILSLSKTSISLKLVKVIDDETLSKFIAHIFHLPLVYLKNKRVGEMMKRLENMSFIKDLFVKVTVINILDILTILVCSICMFILSRKLASIYLVIIIIYLIISLSYSQKIYKMEKKSLRLSDDFSGNVVEYLDGISSIKNLNGEEEFLGDTTESLKKSTLYRLKKDRRILRVEVFKNTAVELLTLSINLVAFLSFDGAFTVYDFLVVQSIYSILLDASTNIVASIEDYIKGKAIYQRMSEFANIEEERTDPIFTEPINKIIIDDLSYSYDHIHKNISNLSLTIDRGEKILLVGPSGIGKSTFVKCLTGIIKNYTGHIFLNDKETKNMSIRSLRNKICYIGQEEKLFSTTLEKNITMGREKTEKFQEVLKTCSLESTIENRSSKETTAILEGASNLSGGERSRVCLARALYRNPEVLIIDETLSSVSENMEKDILANLLSMKDLTLIYITHRNRTEQFQRVIEFRKDGIREIK